MKEQATTATITDELDNLRQVRETLRVGYVRVSSKGQNVARQVEAMKGLVDCYEVEYQSGKSIENRKVLTELLSALKPNDTLFVHSLHRLGRNTKELSIIVEDLTDRNINVHFVTNNLTFQNTPESKLILTMMGAASTFEREMIAARRDEGISVAKQAGKYKGKQPNRALHDKIESMLKLGKNTPDEIAKLVDCGRATVYRVRKAMVTK